VSTSVSVIIPSSTKSRKNIGPLSVTVYRCTCAFINSVLGIPLLYLCLQIVVVYRQTVDLNPAGGMDVLCVVIVVFCQVEVSATS